MGKKNFPYNIVYSVTAEFDFYEVPVVDERKIRSEVSRHLTTGYNKGNHIGGNRYYKMYCGFRIEYSVDHTRQMITVVSVRSR